MKKLVLAAALCSIVLTAQAEEKIYAGLGLGYATQKQDDRETQSEFTVNVSGHTVESHSTTSSVPAIQNNGKLGAKIYAGYQFNDNFALEVGYSYLGKSKAAYTYNGMVDQDTEEVNTLVKGQLLSITANGMFPVNDSFSLLGKLGVGAYYSQTSIRAKIDGEDITKPLNKTSAVPVVGVGAEFKLNKTLALRAEYEYFGKPKFADDTKMKRVDMFSIGLRSVF